MLTPSTGMPCRRGLGVKEPSERLRAGRGAVIYGVGEVEAWSALLPRLSAFVGLCGWSLVDVCHDGAASTHPAGQPGLREALNRLRCNEATTALVMHQHTYEVLPDRLWLKIAVQTAGGVLVLPAPADLAVVTAGSDHIQPVHAAFDCARISALLRRPKWGIS